MVLRKHILGLLVLVSLLVCESARAQEYVLLVHPPSNETIDRQTALTLFRGERRNWKGGIDARVVLPSRESDHYESLAQQLFGLSGSGMERQWFRLVFAGQVNPPIYLDSDEEVERYIAEHPGAVGVVDGGALTDPATSDVLVIPF